MRLHSEDQYIKEHIKDGMTGLELESHRIDGNGNLAHTKHPFPGSPYIDRDFSEAQMEINTPPADSPAEALEFLENQLALVHEKIGGDGELLWPFSNPPIIKGEDDIPIARYEGDLLPSYYYRIYLAERYGKYKMTYSGIHYNYSFSEELLRRNFEIDEEAGAYDGDFDEYKNQFYLKLAEKALAYSWVVVSLLAASPIVDNSFYELGKSGDSIFTGFSSLRCSEFGYWNPFLPILSYESIEGYTGSIEGYLDQGLLIQARELYYPVRIKPPGKYTLQALKDDGISHIELRQVDLNPFVKGGADIRDMNFLKLLLIYLASVDMETLSQQDQMQALQNHKTAAQYDWDIARITTAGKQAGTLREYLRDLLTDMKEFYAVDKEALELLDYQQKKVDDDDFRYASRVRKEYGEDYITKGIHRAKKIQEAFDV